MRASLALTAASVQPLTGLSSELTRRLWRPPHHPSYTSLYRAHPALLLLVLESSLTSPTPLHHRTYFDLLISYTIPTAITTTITTTTIAPLHDTLVVDRIVLSRLVTITCHFICTPTV